jgi:TP901 family phage tail tape measure protein
MISGFRNAEGSMIGFTSRAKAEALKVRNIYSNLQQQLAAMGLAAGMGATIWQSAKLDKSLTQIGQTAGESSKQVSNLRSELFRMGRDSGQDVDSLKDGFNSLVQSGLNMRESLETIKGINVAMAVTGADARVLAAGLTVAATAFEFDLKNPGLALELLDKMTAAGRLGNAELQNLSDIFARVGVNAKSAGMDFNSTLAFIEALSLVERQPERLATLADSTLRLFTNLRYMADAQKGTGIQFFNAKGQRRETTEIFRDIKAKYDTFKTDKERALFMFRLLPHADLDTIKGLRTLLSGDYLQKIKEFAEIIKNAGGTLNRDMSEATKNLVDQAGRLKNTMRQAADEFANPIKEVLADLIKWGLDKKENGGLGLTGGDIATGGAALVFGTYAASKYGGKLFEKIFGKGAGGALGGKAIDLFKGQAGLVAQITYAKQIQAISGVTPVYVVNWPNSAGINDGGGIDITKSTATRGAGARAFLTRFGVPGAIIATMLGATAMAVNAKGDSQDPFTDIAEKVLKKAEIKNQIALNIRIDKEGRVISDTSDFNTEVEVSLMREAF